MSVAGVLITSVYGYGCSDSDGLLSLQMGEKYFAITYVETMNINYRAKFHYSQHEMHISPLGFETKTLCFICPISSAHVFVPLGDKVYAK